MENFSPKSPFVPIVFFPFVLFFHYDINSKKPRNAITPIPTRIRLAIIVENAINLERPPGSGKILALHLWVHIGLTIHFLHGSGVNKIIIQFTYWEDSIDVSKSEAGSLNINKIAKEIGVLKWNYPNNIKEKYLE